MGPPLPTPNGFSFLLLLYFLPQVSSTCFLTPSLIVALSLVPALEIGVVDCWWDFDVAHVASVSSVTAESEESS